MSGIGTTGPALAISAPGLSFGSEPTGTVAVQTVRITNTATRAETITSQVTPSASSGFQIEGLPTVGSIFEPGTSATVTVSYAPSRTGAARARVGVRAGSISAMVRLSGTATAGSRHLSISVRTLNFGTVRVGKSVTKTFDLEVTGTDNLSVSTIRLPSGPFRAENPLASGSGLYPRAPVALTVRFRPAAMGHFSETYVFDAHDGQGRQTVRLVATAAR
jgi:spore coat protein U-like protein